MAFSPLFQGLQHRGGAGETRRGAARFARGQDEDRLWRRGLQQGFRKTGVPLVIIHFNGTFHYKPSSFGYPH